MKKILIAMAVLLAVSPAMAQSGETEQLNLSEVEMANPDSGILEFEPGTALRPVEETKDGVSVAVGLRTKGDVAAERSAEAVEELEENDTDTAFGLMADVEQKLESMPEQAKAKGLKKAAKGLSQAQKQVESKADRNQTIQIETFEEEEVSISENLTVSDGYVSFEENQTSGQVTVETPPKEFVSVSTDVSGENENNSVSVSLNTENGTVDLSNVSELVTAENITVELQRNENASSPVVYSVTVKVKQFDVPSPVFQGMENTVAKAKGLAKGNGPSNIEVPNPNVGGMDEINENIKVGRGNGNGNGNGLGNIDFSNKGPQNAQN